MILILSTDTDFSTDEVCDWLRFYGAPYARLNDNDVFKDKISVNLENSRFVLTAEAGDQRFSSDDVEVVWFRKFGFYSYSRHFDLIRSRFPIEFSSYSSVEYKGFLSAVLNALKNKKWLLKPHCLKYSKIEILEHAVDAGLKVPHTLLTNNLDQFRFEDMGHGTCITKNIHDARKLNIQEKRYVSLYTNRLAPSDDLPGFFFPSIIQEHVDKDVELRIFYLQEELYAMAIFSQLDPQTAMDFRKYNFIKPVREVPFRLPGEIESGIIALMKKLDMNTGSLDMILTPEGEYYFLEVNPVGQFGMVSKPCNYQLEKKVALSLIKMHDHG
jgi:ATP-GRASP peptide maturase of grasp-with-spasm system